MFKKLVFCWELCKSGNFFWRPSLEITSQINRTIFLLRKLHMMHKQEGCEKVPSWYQKCEYVLKREKNASNLQTYRNNIDTPSKTIKIHIMRVFLSLFLWRHKSKYPEISSPLNQRNNSINLLLRLLIATILWPVDIGAIVIKILARRGNVCSNHMCLELTGPGECLHITW